MHGGQGGTYYYEKENKSIDRLIVYFLILALVALTLSFMNDELSKMIL